MNIRSLLFLTALTPGALSAQQLAYEACDYTSGAAVTGLNGGNGWSGAWTVNGMDCTIRSEGLNYTDSTGNVLTAAGLSITTVSTATTRIFRYVNPAMTNVWISFLYHLPSSNAKFEGVSFYRGTAGTFSVHNPASSTTGAIFLTNNVSGATVNTNKGVLGTTHFIVLHLIDGGTADRIDCYVDPVLSAVPAAADAVVQGSNLDFDNLRVAGQDGAAFYADEFRIGQSWADVTPHTPAVNGDADGDGLTNAQEAALGTNPAVSDAALFAAIRQNPGYFGLYNTAGILELTQGGIVVERNGAAPVPFSFELQFSNDLSAWQMLETYNRSLTLPAGKNFLRITP